MSQDEKLAGLVEWLGHDADAVEALDRWEHPAPPPPAIAWPEIARRQREAASTISRLSTELQELRADKAKLAELLTYIEDFGKLGGGAMKRKYGDDPMLGYDNVVRRARAALKPETVK